MYLNLIKIHFRNCKKKDLNLKLKQIFRSNCNDNFRLNKIYFNHLMIHWLNDGFDLTGLMMDLI